jgi:hypothetical protein
MLGSNTTQFPHPSIVMHLRIATQQPANVSNGPKKRKLLHPHPKSTAPVQTATLGFGSSDFVPRSTGQDKLCTSRPWENERMIEPYPEVIGHLLSDRLRHSTVHWAVQLRGYPCSRPGACMATRVLCTHLSIIGGATHRACRWEHVGHDVTKNACGASSFQKWVASSHARLSRGLEAPLSTTTSDPRLCRELATI